MGGDELHGLVDPFGARIFISQTKHPECNEGESEEPAGKAATRACTDGADRGSRVPTRERHRSSGTGACGRHRPVTHGQTNSC